MPPSVPATASPLLIRPLLIGALALSLGACAGLAPPAAGAPEAGTQAPTIPANTRLDDFDGEVDAGIEATRRTVRSSAEWLARQVDSWFGDKPFEAERAISNGRFMVGLYHRQHEGSKLKVRFRARFHLPNVERFGYIFIGRDDPDEIVADTPDELSRGERPSRIGNPDDGSFFAGLAIGVRKYVDFRIGARRGAHPYAQLRYLRPWRLSARDRIEFSQTVFWVLDDRFGATSVVKLEHTLTPKLALRWISVYTAAQRDRKREWSSSIGAYRSLGEDRLVSLAAVISHHDRDPSITIDEYGLVAKWEHPLRGRRLFGELSLGRYHWDKFDRVPSSGKSWALGYLLKLRF